MYVCLGIVEAHLYSVDITMKMIPEKVEEVLLYVHVHAPRIEILGMHFFIRNAVVSTLIFEVWIEFSSYKPYSAVMLNPMFQSTCEYFTCWILPYLELHLVFRLCWILL